jgi:hypothetical protein
MCSSCSTFHRVHSGEAGLQQTAVGDPICCDLIRFGLMHCDLIRWRSYLLRSDSLRERDPYERVVAEIEKLEKEAAQVQKRIADAGLERKTLERQVLYLSLSALHDDRMSW